MSDRIPETPVTVPNSSDTTQGPETFRIATNQRHPANAPPVPVRILNPSPVPGSNEGVDMIGDGPREKKPGRTPNVGGQ